MAVAKSVVKYNVIKAMAVSLESNHWNVRYSAVCGGCKEPTLEDDLFCSQCGYELDDEEGEIKSTHLWDAFISGLDEWEEK